jgi:hypothetical protein
MYLSLQLHLYLWLVQLCVCFAWAAAVFLLIRLPVARSRSPAGAPRVRRQGILGGGEVFCFILSTLWALCRWRSFLQNVEPRPAAQTRWWYAPMRRGDAARARGAACGEECGISCCYCCCSQGDRVGHQGRSRVVSTPPLFVLHRIVVLGRGRHSSAGRTGVEERASESERERERESERESEKDAPNRISRSFLYTQQTQNHLRLLLETIFWGATQTHVF